MISEGDKAPAITVTASDGSSVNLAAPGRYVGLHP
jgi:peroxiredoxin Q/BCP